MKLVLLAFLAALSTQSFAHEILGTLLLKGNLKSKVSVNGGATVCKLKVEDVKNYMVEDAFGNPGYQANVTVSLDGKDINFKKEMPIVNVHTVDGVRMVKDFEYLNKPEKLALTMSEQGRVVSVSFPYGYQTVTCRF